MQDKYKVITLCGSTQIKDVFIHVQKRLSLVGNIVILPVFFNKSGDEDI